MEYNTENKIEGYLFKRKTSSFKRIFSMVNKRWFELNREEKIIRYKANLEDEFEDDDKKRIPISEISYVKRLTNEKEVEDKKYHHGFQIIFVDHRREPMTLYAINLTDISKWIIGLTELLKEKNNEIKKENFLSEVGNVSQFEESMYDTVVNEQIRKRKEKNKNKKVHFDDIRVSENTTSFEKSKNILFGEVESSEAENNEVIIENDFKEEVRAPPSKNKSEKKEGSTLKEKINEEKVYKINEDDLSDWNFYDKQGNIVPFELKTGDKMERRKNILGPNVEIIYTKEKNNTESESSEEEEKREDAHLFKYRKEIPEEKKKELEVMKFQINQSKNSLYSQQVKSISNVLSKKSYDNFENWTF